MLLNVFNGNASQFVLVAHRHFVCCFCVAGHYIGKASERLHANADTACCFSWNAHAGPQHIVVALGNVSLLAGPSCHPNANTWRADSAASCRDFVGGRHDVIAQLHARVKQQTTTSALCVTVALRVCRGDRVWWMRDVCKKSLRPIRSSNASTCACNASSWATTRERCPTRTSDKTRIESTLLNSNHVRTIDDHTRRFVRRCSSVHAADSAHICPSAIAAAQHQSQTAREHDINIQSFSRSSLSSNRSRARGRAGSCCGSSTLLLGMDNMYTGYPAPLVSQLQSQSAVRGSWEMTSSHVCIRDAPIGGARAKQWIPTLKPWLDGGLRGHPTMNKGQLQCETLEIAR